MSEKIEIACWCRRLFDSWAAMAEHIRTEHIAKPEPGRKLFQVAVRRLEP
jgi:hypothetical protein